MMTAKKTGDIAATNSKSFYKQNHSNGFIVRNHKFTDNNVSNSINGIESSVLLIEFSFRNFVFLTIGAPVFALLIAFVVGFLIDYQQILDYDWSCGPVHMPSFSRIINLPKERIIWNAALLFHIPLRPFLVWTNYRIFRISSNEIFNGIIHSLLSQIVTISGLIEILMVMLLTVVGEREETYLHVYFFMAFVISSTAYFATVTMTFRNSKHYVEHINAERSFKLKFYLTIVYMALIPLMFTFFYMYWELCYNFAYDFFALLEYIIILMNYVFHLTIIYDCNDRWQFKLRKNHPKIYAAAEFKIALTIGVIGRRSLDLIYSIIIQALLNGQFFSTKITNRYTFMWRAQSGDSLADNGGIDFVRIWEQRNQRKQRQQCGIEFRHRPLLCFSQSSLFFIVTLLEFDLDHFESMVQRA